MAKTATKKRKVSTGKARRKAPKASTNGKAAGQSAKFAPNQPPISGMEDVDERIEVLDEECQRFLSIKDQQRSLKEDEGESRQKIGDLIKEHGLELYKLNGMKFWIEPGTPTVKVTKLNQKG